MENETNFENIVVENNTTNKETILLPEDIMENVNTQTENTSVDNSDINSSNAQTVEENTEIPQNVVYSLNEEQFLTITNSLSSIENTIVSKNIEIENTEKSDTNLSNDILHINFCTFLILTSILVYLFLHFMLERRKI